MKTAPHRVCAGEAPSSWLMNWSPLTESNRRPSPYHGDALPTELRGRVLSCLTWASATPGAPLRSCTPVLRVIRSGRPRAYRTSRVLASSPPGVEPAPDPLRLSQQQADPGVLASPPVNNGRPCTR